MRESSLRTYRRWAAAALSLALACAVFAESVGPPPKAHASSVFANFITRSGDQLMDGSSVYRFMAVSAPTLHRNEDMVLDEATERWPDLYEIDDQLDTIVRLGGTATRIYGLSYKKNNTREWHVNGLGDYNENAFVVLDQVLARANAKGVRIIFPFIDAHSFGSWGGIDEFVSWSGHARGDFWSNPTVKANFKALMYDVLNRTNTITGVKYKDDKAILAWQLGNELELWGCTDAWVSEMAAYLKSIDPNHLVMDGRDRNFDGVLSDPNIDIVGGHYYSHYDGSDLDGMAAADRATAYGKKALIVDEFGLGDTADLIDLMDEIIGNGTSGGLLWSIRGHKRSGGFRYHPENGGYRSYHAPGFAVNDDIDETNLLAALRSKAYEIRGLPEPPVDPPEAPTMLTVNSPSRLYWQGSAGASSYQVQRASSSAGPWTTIATGVIDDKGPIADAPLYADEPAAGTHLYRVIAVNDGGSSAPSNYQTVVVREDPLDDWSGVHSRTSNLKFDSSNSGYMDSDTSRARRTGAATNEEIVWYESGIKSFEMFAYYWPGEPVSHFSFYVSPDGTNWTSVAPIVSGGTGDWIRYRYLLDDLRSYNASYVKVRWNNTSGEIWSPQIGKVFISDLK